MNANVKFDVEGFRTAAYSWFDENMEEFESQQDANDCLYEWLSANIGRFTEVVVK
jgi:hypothetical protein